MVGTDTGDGGTEQGGTKKQSTFCAQLCKKDKKKFMKYIQSTTTHGVVRVFTGKSKIRRLFWLFVVLIAAGVCLGNIIERAIYLASQPTATTLSQVRQSNLTFPAVTICNLNQVKRSKIAELGEEILQVIELLLSNNSGICDNPVLFSGQDDSLSFANELNLRDILYEARHLAEDMIIQCLFAGEFCGPEDFELVLTRLGYCYVFNSGDADIKTTLGTGVRHGLSLVLNIEQDEYLINNGDAGVKIAIHGQNEPAEPDENGLGVPPGTNAFISLKKRIVEDSSGSRRSRCREAEDTEQFNFLHETFNYSTSACLIDCFYTNITEECECIEANVEYPPQSSQFNNIRNCSADDLCCVIDLYIRPQVCDCPAACVHDSFESKISYSGYPGELMAPSFAQWFQLPVDDLSKNLMSVNIYYETFNVEMEITKDSYSPIAFLSDMGGLLGLFIGASVISVLEFVTWLLDEFKDRCIGVNDKEIEKWSEELEYDLAEYKRNKDKEETKSCDATSKSHDPHTDSKSVQVEHASEHI